jgi:group I intron endonuclease
MGYIYKITNIKNNKCYIGETIQTPEKRWKDHKGAMKRDGGCRALKMAIKKYGLENFKFEVIIICFDEDRLIYEKEYIKKYNSMAPNGYNILAGGQEGVLGFKHSEETRKIISAKSKENSSKPEMREKSRQRMIELHKRINSGEVVKKTSKWYKALEEGRIGNRGGKMNNEVKCKISNSLKTYYASDNKLVNINKDKWQQMLKNKKGSNLNENHRNNISAGLTNYFNSQYESFYNNTDNVRDSRTKLIAEYNDKDELIKIYPSIAEASRKLGITAHHMGKIVRRKNNKYNNSVWKYYDEKNLKTNQ